MTFLLKVVLLLGANQCSPGLNLCCPKQGIKAFYWGIGQENWYLMLLVQFSLCEDAKAVI